MEDRHGHIYFSDHLHLFWIADGHGGDEVAICIEQEIDKIVSAEYNIVRQHIQYDEDIAREFLNRIFNTLNSVIEDTLENKYECGSTLTICLISQTRIYVAYCGDSRVIWGDHASVLGESMDHNSSNISECDRVQKAGGYIFFGRLLGSLAVFRSLGDFKFVPYITHEPDIQVLHRQNIHTLVLASDGIYEALENHEVFEIAAKEKEHHATKLVNTAFKEGSSDNLTAIVIHL